MKIDDKAERVSTRMGGCMVALFIALLTAMAVSTLWHLATKDVVSNAAVTLRDGDNRLHGECDLHDGALWCSEPAAIYASGEWLRIERMDER